MSARAKTAPAAPPLSEETTTTTSKQTTGNQLQNLERRLQSLEEGGNATPATTTTTTTTIGDITTVVVAPSPQASAAATTTTNSSNNNNNPLLKRIQAAQERARLAEQQEKAATIARQAAETERQRLEEEAAWANEERERIQRAQDKLRSVANRAIEDRQRGATTVQTQQPLLPGEVGTGGGGGGIKSIATTKVSTDSVAASLLAELEQRPTMAIPIMKSLDPPPPSFTSMKFPPPLEMQQQLKLQQHIQPPQSISEMMMVGHGMNSRVLRENTAVVAPTHSSSPPPPPPPPSFEFVERQIMYNTSNSKSTIIEPSAPSISPGTEENDYDLLGVMPVAYMPYQQQQQGVLAPPPPFPPSFAEFESSQQQQQQFAPAPPSHNVINTNSNTNDDEELLLTEDDIDAFKYDENGKLLTNEQRQLLITEQRQLYEQIMKEKAANDTAIAIAKAEEFDLRSSMSATRAMDPDSILNSEQRQLYEQIMKEKAAATRAMMVQQSGSSSLSQSSQEGDGSTAQMDRAGRDINGGGNEEEDSNGTSATQRMVQIGNNQVVALHGQERTKKAIKEGTAILVQCINCQNWMQVTESATLMFCPVCQVVSPVVKQSEVLTKEEAIQLTMDRKLAEKLQAEYNSQVMDETVTEGQQSSKTRGEEDGYFTRLFGSSTMKYPATTSALSSDGTSNPVKQMVEGADSTWWNKLSSFYPHGVTAPTNESVRGELGVTLPPGAAAAQQSTTTTASSSSGSRYNNEETRGLLSPVTVDDNDANLPAARIAESRPLFSCLADSVSSATSALWSSTGSDPELEESLLITSSTGREERDTHGDYAQL